MKSLLFFAASAAALFAAAPAFAQTSNANPGASSSMKSGDKRFIEHVAQDGKAEVDFAQLAQQKAQSPDVKALAQRLAADHMQSNQQLMQIALKQGVEPPSNAGKEASKERAKLEKLNGQAFDRAYVQQVVQDHRKDIQYFQKQETTLQDPRLKSFAQQTMPVLQQHLQMAEQAASASGSSSRSGSSTNSSAGRMTR